MRTILIVSPDPEAGRALTLAFELDGWSVSQSTTIEGARGKGCDVVLLDMVEGTKGFTEAEFKGSKILAIAPRGRGEDAVCKKVPRSGVVFRRPYDMMHLVKTAGELVCE